MPISRRPRLKMTLLLTRRWDRHETPGMCFDEKAASVAAFYFGWVSVSLERIMGIAMGMPQYRL